MKRSLWLCGVMCVLGAVGEVIYENDFSVRTSKGGVPSAEWRELTYRQDWPLYYNYLSQASAAFDPYQPWNPDKDFQDGWAKPRLDVANVTLGSPGFVLATDPVHGSEDNPCAVFRSSSKKTGVAVQRFANEFTNGILRIDVDMRRPAGNWGDAGELSYVRVAPVYRKYVEALNWNNTIGNVPFFRSCSGLSPVVRIRRSPAVPSSTIARTAKETGKRS